MRLSPDLSPSPSTIPTLELPPQAADSSTPARPMPDPRWWRDACGVFVWASLLLVVALWVSGAGVQALASPATGLTSVGRLTGLVASDLVLIQVLLMARIPMVERSYGQDELAGGTAWWVSPPSPSW